MTVMTRPSQQTETPAPTPKNRRPRLITIILLIVFALAVTGVWLVANHVAAPPDATVILEARAAGGGTVSYDGGSDGNIRFSKSWSARYRPGDAARIGSILVTPDGEDKGMRAYCAIRVGDTIMTHDTADYDGGMALCVMPPIDKLTNNQ